LRVARIWYLIFRIPTSWVVIARRAECFLVFGLSAKTKKKILSLCDLCGSSVAGGEKFFKIRNPQSKIEGPETFFEYDAVIEMKEQKWDEETDVVVIGSGFAGLAAAIEAKNAGCSVIILEKMKGFGAVR
jgi:NADPH-dependent 2,4-dienoyl-CoA reductase/sulfur reductase-like enzyme